MRVKSLSFLFSFLVIFLFFASQARAATITPDIFEDEFILDSDHCSLREAVEAVDLGNFNNLPGCLTNSNGSLGDNDTIILQEGEYELTIGSTNEDFNEDGDIDILKPVIIQGQGAGATTVKGNFPQGEEDRIFQIFVNSVEPPTGEPIEPDVTLTGITVTHGDNPESMGFGGGISNINSITLLDNIEVSDSFADFGGGIDNSPGAGFAFLFIKQSLVTGNEAIFGGGISNFGAGLSVEESIIDMNDALGPGGGIITAGLAFISNTTISHNTSEDGDGGGIFDYLANSTPMYLINSTVSTNDAINGGGVAHEFEIQGLAEQSSPITAAQAQPPALPVYFNVTVADNEATESGGGLFIVNQDQIQGSQIISPQLYNTLVARNSAGEEGSEDCSGEYTSMEYNFIGKLGPNQCIGFTDGVNNDQVGSVQDPKDPKIGDLADNGGPNAVGGPPQTQALLVGSPAIDKGNNVDGCQAPDLEELFTNKDFVLVTLDRDERDFTRPVAILDPNNPICDIGAFEVQQFDFTLTKTDGLGGSKIPAGTEFDYTITITNPGGSGDATNVTLSDPLPSGMSFVSVATTQGTCSESGGTVTCDLGTLVDGASITVTITVTAEGSGTFTNVATVTLLNPQQQEMTKTAQVKTEVGGLIFEGSGKFCSLEKGDPRTPPGFALLLFSITVMIGTVYLSLRRRAKSSR